MISEEYTLGFDAFLRSFKQNLDSPFAFLLGAGASISSGIHSAEECLWDWKKQIYLSNNPSDATFLDIHLDCCKQIIQMWLDKQKKYPSLNDPNEYEFYAETAFPFEEDRTKYFKSLCYDKKPYIGYKLLCLLNKYGVVKSVWTTNFDSLVENAAYLVSVKPTNVNLLNSQVVFNNENNNELLCIALHGDYKYDKLKNTRQELDNQNQDFVDRLGIYFVDRNLIVIGYSGRDKSLMNALKYAFSKKGRGRLYWCGYGNKLNDEIRELLKTAQDSGREARYINTDGFDETMTSLLLSSYREDIDKKNEIDSILKSEQKTVEVKPFILDNCFSTGCIKTNLYPVSFPKDVYQFEINYPNDCNEWNFIKERIKPLCDIVAVPLNGKVYAFSFAEVIHTAFGNVLKSTPTRTPITIEAVSNNSALKALFLKTLLCGLSAHSNLHLSLSKAILYNKQFLFNGNKGVYEGIKLDILYKGNLNYALLSVTPTLYFENKESYSIEKYKSIFHDFLDKKRNRDYEKTIQTWENIIFKGKRAIFDFPLKSNNNFIFKIGNNRGFVDIDYTDKGVISEHPYISQHKLFTGTFICEPKLEFISRNSNKIVLDSNPMRGLKNNYPYDYLFQSKFNKEIKLGVICPISYQQAFKEFLCGLNGINHFGKDSDYIQDYSGFFNTYASTLNIPATNSPEWISCHDEQKDPILLAQNICKCALKIVTNNPGIIVLIFIPQKWERLRKFEQDGTSFDLHNYVKAYAAQSGFTTQFIEEKTINDKRMKTEIYWWLSLALFTKSMRSPWALSNLDEKTAYAGLGYSLKKNQDRKPTIMVGCSHIYNSKGQGLRYKLSQIDNPLFDKKKNPYLSYEEAFKVGMNIQQMFIKSMDCLPKRVVIHKRTPFHTDEIHGLIDALSQANINDIDLVTITIEDNIRGINQYLAQGVSMNAAYPVWRGVCFPLSETEFILWTHGTVESIANKRSYFPGGRGIPSPLRVTKFYGNGNMITIAKEILGFTKMNWNSFNFYTKFPATIDTSNTLAQIGDLLNHTNGETYDYRYFI